jgi:hypothetical protein
MRAVFIIDRRQTVHLFWATKDHASEPDYDLLLERCAQLD